VVGDIHHIIPVKNGGTDHNTNLTYICPNCHRLTHSNYIKKEELVSIEDYLGDSWKEYYFTK
jgi:predicted HNH restriction endonuclease